MHVIYHCSKQFITDDARLNLAKAHKFLNAIKEFKITEVKQPYIGEVKPSSVTAEVTYSVSSYKAHITSQWDALKEHDVLLKNGMHCRGSL